MGPPFELGNHPGSENVTLLFVLTSSSLLVASGNPTLIERDMLPPP
jgi:hypothetical protein